MDRNMIKNGLIFLAVILIGLTLFIAIRNQIYSAEVEFEFAPRNAVVKLDGKLVKFNEKLRKKPGKYKLIGNQKGFLNYEREIELKKGLNDKLRFFLEEEEGNDYYEKNIKDRLLVEKIIDSAATEGAEALNKKYPILRILPLDLGADRFEINYEFKDDDFTVWISDCRNGNRVEADKYIRSFNFRPEDYNIKCRVN